MSTVSLIKNHINYYVLYLKMEENPTVQEKRLKHKILPLPIKSQFEKLNQLKKQSPKLKLFSDQQKFPQIGWLQT